ncbi:MAG: DUF1446 domain-containing protein [Alphaproteobacteria bacterium]|nr:DUF1446 domain-containing protein [Alphaproteobacteria bacterium]
MTNGPLIIGGASGFWGEASHATRQLLTTPDLDFLVYDYLAEITMSIMARARLKDPELGYATDFIAGAMGGNLAEISKKKVRVLSNAGGVNPEACAKALEDAARKAGVSLKIAVVTGDDLSSEALDFSDIKEMFDGKPFPALDTIASINAYLGAFPLAAALDAGADIVLTGRCADSALVLAACIHHFGWRHTNHDLLAAGSLAGHLLECGPQATGGNFTDWERAGDLAEIGYPVAEVNADGAFVVTKPPETTGIVVPASVGEQMLYEIGDPQAYCLPDVICDFSQVTMQQSGADRVRVSGARGRRPTGKLKVSTTYMDGYRAGHVLQFNGRDARQKAIAYGELGLKRARGYLKALGLADYEDTCFEVSGGRPGDSNYEEVSFKAAVRHKDSKAVGIFLREIIGGALAAPPGLHFFTGAGRPKPSPVVRLYSFLIDAVDVPATVVLDGKDIGFEAPVVAVREDVVPGRPPDPAVAKETAEKLVTCTLEELAWARSGDKGDAANIGVIARHDDYVPWIWRALDEETIARVFAPHLKGRIERFVVPGIGGMNILLHEVLGGGGIASLRDDAQGKGFAQKLLAVPVDLPQALLAGVEKGSH